MITCGPSDFIVVEQGFTFYIQHVFVNRKQFINWRQDNQDLVIVARNNSRGRQLPGVDHRNEIAYWD